MGARATRRREHVPLIGFIDVGALMNCAMSEKMCEYCKVYVDCAGFDKFEGPFKVELLPALIVPGKLASERVRSMLFWDEKKRGSKCKKILTC